MGQDQARATTDDDAPSIFQASAQQPLATGAVRGQQGGPGPVHEKGISRGVLRQVEPGGPAAVHGLQSQRAVVAPAVAPGGGGVSAAVGAAHPHGLGRGDAALELRGTFQHVGRRDGAGAVQFERALTDQRRAGKLPARLPQHASDEAGAFVHRQHAAGQPQRARATQTAHRDGAAAERHHGTRSGNAHIIAGPGQGVGGPVARVEPGNPVTASIPRHGGRPGPGSPCGQKQWQCSPGRGRAAGLG